MDDDIEWKELAKTHRVGRLQYSKMKTKKMQCIEREDPSEDDNIIYVCK